MQDEQTWKYDVVSHGKKILKEYSSDTTIYEALEWAIKEIEQFRKRQVVIQDWVLDMPLKMQSVLLLGLRGPDQFRAPGIKTITRWLRSLTFVPGDPTNVFEFMRVELPLRIEEKSEIARELEFVSQHYYSHLMHALEEVGYGHPDKEIAKHAFELYRDMCRLFHLPIEFKDDHWKRLGPMEWPEGKQPRDGKEAFELMEKHGFSERDLKAMERKHV